MDRSGLFAKRDGGTLKSRIFNNSEINDCNRKINDIAIELSINEITRYNALGKHTHLNILKFYGITKDDPKFDLKTSINLLSDSKQEVYYLDTGKLLKIELINEGSFGD
ncbi:1678_t:CDS:2 [Gigaspora margarita]|uniref:1678_t:CDS:1 n=1 Tax=Gigaspora margarita TaxID=4874 RepID=A0ABN7UBD9_GIGMA|nr:1678_t:CDS:2 [Gigaspora margarita]